MTPSPEPRLARFSRAERWTHRAIAVLVVTLIVSAACLYFPDLSALVGNRELFKRLHIIAGFVLPVPILIALCIAAFRADLTRLNRFTPDDWRWFRKQQRRTGALKIGKFNAGQKLHSHVEAGALIVLFGTGMIMYFSGVFSDDLRTGATFVHDWVALGVALLVAGHVYKAYSDAGAREGMRTGYVTVEWAQLHHPSWADQAPSWADQAPSQPHQAPSPVDPAPSQPHQAPSRVNPAPSQPAQAPRRSEEKHARTATPPPEHPGSDPGG